MSTALRKASWMLGWLGALGAVVAALAGSTDLAVALVGVAVLACGVAAFLSFRALADVVRSEVSHAVRAAKKAGTEPKNALGAAQVEEIVERRTKAVSSGISALARRIDHQPYVHVELQRKYAQLIGTSDEPMPVLGANWAATAPSILFIVDEILGRDARRTMIECGSGASTIWTAAALRHRGDGGHVWSLEADAAYAQVTRQNLARHGLEEWATVIDAPLVETPVDELGTVQRWYDLSGLPDDVGKADLLFVDGPPARTAKMARFPALAMLSERLRDGAVIVLDDTNRAPERAATRRWAASGANGRTVRILKDVGRSTVMEIGA
jgi:predicted O-methyltransferase YrrM